MPDSPSAASTAAAAAMESGKHCPPPNHARFGGIFFAIDKRIFPCYHRGKGDVFLRKDFGSKPWFYPLPVLIIGTYDENGVLDAGGKISMQRFVPLVFNPVTNDYLKVEGTAGKAFDIGRRLK